MAPDIYAEHASRLSGAHAAFQWPFAFSMHPITSLIPNGPLHTGLQSSPLPETRRCKRNGSQIKSG